MKPGNHFIIPGRLPGYNELLGASKAHWAKGYRAKQSEMDHVVWCVKAYKVKPTTEQAQVHITCYEPNRRRDVDNVQSGAKKIILDALQKAGIIRNDSWKWLAVCTCEVLADKENPRIEVVVGEAESCG